jgi:hypothetical protein
MEPELRLARRVATRAHCFDIAEFECFEQSVLKLAHFTIEPFVLSFANLSYISNLSEFGSTVDWCRLNSGLTRLQLVQGLAGPASVTAGCLE